MNKKNQFFLSWLRPLPMLALSMMLSISACSTGGDDDENTVEEVLNLDMQIPASLTGGVTAVSSLSVIGAQASSSGTGQPCAFQGPDDKDDPFRNGYEMTKFMVSVVAAWTCWADDIIEIAGYVPHDGLVKATENQKDNPNYEPDEPTHYKVVDSASQTSVYIYYDYDRDVPPLADEDPQFYFSWNEDENGDIEGRMVVDGTAIDPENRNPEDPVKMRMDFTYTATEKLVDMFLQFDNGNQWADGFRIEVSKDLTAAPFEKVFTARGLINMKSQFFDVPGVPELPVLRMYTVSDRSGEGAAIADFIDVSLPLELNADTGNYLGDYIFDKIDMYFFDADQTVNEPWDWIQKTFTAAEYRGSRTTPATGGTFIPFDPSLDMIVTELGLPSSYFTGTECVRVYDSCVELLNAIFESGFAEQEPNQGADPNDWRSVAILSIQPSDYLDTVYPNGVDWTGAFDYEFTPTP